MRKLIVFNHVSLDGYLQATTVTSAGLTGGNDDPEYLAFVAENAGGEGELLFGRVTYDLMVSYWPTPMASHNDPKVAEGMNRMRKVVFSKTLDTASWNNTQLVKSDLVAAVRKMKEAPGPDMTILGSGTIIAQLAPAGVIDEYHLMLDPVILGRGRTMFEGIPDKLNLNLTKTRVFKNGKAHLIYQPIT
jgi:dihydrofolate reductase